MKRKRTRERRLFEAWMDGHCWSLGRGWCPTSRQYLETSVGLLWDSWRNCAMSKKTAEPVADPGPSESLLRLSHQIGAGRIPVPLDDAERSRFEGWAAREFPFWGFLWDPTTAHYSTMTARMLWAAWRDRAAYERYAVFTVICDPTNAHLFSVAAAQAAFAHVKVPGTSIAEHNNP